MYIHSKIQCLTQPHKQCALVVMYFRTDELNFSLGLENSCHNEPLWLRPVLETLKFRNVTVQTDRKKERKTK